MSDLIEGTRGQTPEDRRQLPSAPRPEFAPGETVPGLSSWVLERKLGGGGFGEVWLVRHTLGKEKPRAVKFCLDPVARHRLITHEKNVVVRVMKYAGDHPNIVPLRDYNLDGDIPWLMYEFVEGGTLASLIQAWRDLPLPKLLGKAVQTLHAIASALATCHRLDPPLVHRDMKPQNVLMADGKFPRITDFGIGGVVVVAEEPGVTGGMTALAARLPSVLQNAGTRNYAPAEQLFGSPPNPRDDVYALGIIAYQMLLGDLTTAPGPDANLELRDLKIPGELASLIVRSVAMNPDRRPKDATEWESTLAAIIEKARKKPETTDTASVGSKPVLLPEPEPTKGPSVRTGPPPIPPPLPPKPLLPKPRPAEPWPVFEPVREDPPPRANRKSSGRGLALVIGGVLLLALCLGGLLVAVLPPGKRSDPTSPSAGLDTPKSNESKEAGNSNTKGSAPEPLVVVPVRKGGDTCEIEIAPGVKMTFCWIPKGECQLGSPKAERDVVLKLIKETEEPGWLSAEAEEVRPKFHTDGFWMGKYEVTQAEWEAVMGDNPSYFRVGGVGASKLGEITDTSKFPVERVSWDMICKSDGFLDKINAHGGIQKTFGKPGKFVLPHEDEWEYACRGHRDKRPFYWGDKLNGTQANCDGNYPYGTDVKGTYLERTCAVDFTNEGKYPEHPWGLMHMHGNVWEWCTNEYSKDRRILRGGSWNNSRRCRSAYRGNNVPDSVYDSFGFRLVVPGLP